MFIGLGSFSNNPDIVEFDSSLLVMDSPNLLCNPDDVYELLSLLLD